MIDSVASQSDLALDASMDTFTMMQLETNRIPAVQELVGQLRGLGAGVATSGSFNADSYIRVNSVIASLKDAASQVEHKFSILRQFYPEHIALLKPALADYTTTLHAFQDMTQKQLVDPDSPTVSGEDYFNQGTLAISSGAALFKETKSVFDNKLTFYREEKVNSLILIFAIFTALLLVSTYLLLCLKNSLDNNVNSALKMASDLESNILNSSYSSDSKDELGKTFILRKILSPMGTTEAMEFLLDKIKNTKTNGEFFQSMGAKS